VSQEIVITPTVYVLFSHQLEIHRFLPFGLMAGLASVAAIVCMTLPETLNKPTMEDLTEDKKKPAEEENDNKIVKDGKEEEDTLM